MARKRHHSGSVPDIARMKRRVSFCENVKIPGHGHLKNEDLFPSENEVMSQCLSSGIEHRVTSEQTKSKDITSCSSLGIYKSSAMCAELTKSAQRMQTYVPSCNDKLFVSKLLKNVIEKNTNFDNVQNCRESSQQCPVKKLSELTKKETARNQLKVPSCQNAIEEKAKALREENYCRTTNITLTEKDLNGYSFKNAMPRNESKTSHSDLICSGRTRKTVKLIPRSERGQKCSCVIIEQLEEATDTSSTDERRKCGREMEFVETRCKINTDETMSSNDKTCDGLQSSIQGCEDLTTSEAQAKTMVRKPDLQLSQQQPFTKDQLNCDTHKLDSGRKQRRQMSNISKNSRDGDQDLFEEIKTPKIDSEYCSSDLNENHVPHENNSHQRLSQSCDEDTLISVLHKEEHVRRSRLGCVRKSASSLDYLRKDQRRIPKRRSEGTLKAVDYTTSKAEKRPSGNRCHMSSPALLISGSYVRDQGQNVAKRRRVNGVIDKVPIVTAKEDDGKQMFIQQIHQRIANVSECRETGLSTKLPEKETDTVSMNVELLEEMIPLDGPAQENWKRQSSGAGQNHFLHHSSGTIWNNVVSKFLTR